MGKLGLHVLGIVHDLVVAMRICERKLELVRVECAVPRARLRHHAGLLASTGHRTHVSHAVAVVRIDAVEAVPGRRREHEAHATVSSVYHIVPVLVDDARTWLCTARTIPVRMGSQGGPSLL
eukprot:3515275-Prymnesium_polylepis.1